MEPTRPMKRSTGNASVVEYQRLESLVNGQCQVLDMITQGRPLSNILEAITQWVEAQSQDDLLTSILLVDNERQCLLHGAAPSLPEVYSRALHELPIGPRVGSCGTAAYTKEPVVVRDIAEDPLWDDYRALALPHGLRACWSTPLIARNGQVVGTFAMYYREPRVPTQDDLHIIRLVSQTATLAIEHRQAEEDRVDLLAREQKALAQAESERHRLHHLVMQAPAAIALLRGSQHVYELANPLYLRAVGKRQGVLGRPIMDVLPELRSQGIMDLLDRVYTTGKPHVSNESLIQLDRKGDGTLEDVYFNFVYQPSVDDTGAVDGVLVYAVEVTELVKARQRAEESEERFRMLADNMSQFAWIADETGYIIWYNQRWYDYTGTTLEEMKGWGWMKVHHPDHVDRVVEKLSGSFRTGEPWEDTFPLRGKDGSYRWFLSRAIPIRDESGHVTRWFGTNTDVTHQRQLQQQNEDFIGIASHELKTPVTSLKAYAQLLSLRFRKAGDARSAELLERMDGQLNKLTKLITDLLDETKIQSGRLALQVSRFDYAELMREVIEEVQRTAIWHTISCEEVAPCVIEGDRERIGQVLINLLTNAVKYSPEADRVIVRTVVENGEVVTSVQDFGIGISNEKQGKVFDRFFRIQEQDEQTYPGLGLGLYISAEIVRRHRGRIWVESLAGEGSTFIFALPLDAPAQ